MSQVRANSITNAAGTGAPDFPNGLTVNGSPAGGTQTFTATGTIPNGALVGLNADGTVSVVSALTGSSFNQSGATAYGTSTYPAQVSSCFDSVGNKVFVAYTSIGPNLQIGTVNGKSITFGSSTSFGSYPTSAAWNMDYDTTNSKLITSAGQIGTVSGTAVTWTNYNGPSGLNSIDSVSFDPTNGKVIFGGRDTNNYPVAFVGTISGTSISFGPVVVLNSAQTPSTSVSASGGKVIVAYQDTPFTSVKLQVGTVTGTSLSFGAVTAILNTESMLAIGICYKASIERFVVGVRNGQNTNLILGSVSGTNITLSSPYSLEASSYTRPGIVYDATLSSFIVSWEGSVGVCKINGSGLSVKRLISKPFQTGLYNSVTSIGNGNVFYSVSGVTGTSQAAGVIYSTPYNGLAVNASSTLPSFVGVAAESIQNGLTGKVTVVGGLNASQTGLVAGSPYCVPSGTGLLTAGNLENPIGYAKSSTELYINTGRL